MIEALIDAGDLEAAESVCAAALARCRDDGDLSTCRMLLMLMADLDVQAGRFQDAAAHLREGLQVAVRAGDCVECSATACGAARCCAPRPGATPKPPRCWLPRPSTPGTRGSLAMTPGGRADGTKR